MIAAVLPAVREGQAYPHTLRYGGGRHLHLDAPLIVPRERPTRLADRFGGRFRVLHVAVSDKQAGMLDLILPSQLVQVDVRQDLLRHIEILLQIELSQRLVAPGWEMHLIFVQRLEDVDSLGCVLGRYLLRGGGKGGGLPDVQRLQPPLYPRLLPSLTGKFGQVIKIVQNFISIPPGSGCSFMLWMGWPSSRSSRP